MWQDPAYTIHPSLHQLDDPWAKEHVQTCRECITFARHVQNCMLCLAQIESKLERDSKLEFTYP